MTDEQIKVIEALSWVAMYCAVNSVERPLAVCVELSVTPHGGKPRVTRHVGPPVERPVSLLAELRAGLVDHRVGLALSSADARWRLLPT